MAENFRTKMKKIAAQVGEMQYQNEVDFLRAINESVSQAEYNSLLHDLPFEEATGKTIIYKPSNFMAEE